MIKKFQSRQLATLVAGLFTAGLLVSTPVMAATVPAGTVLSSNQEVNLSLKDDPPTLDPNQLREVIGHEINNQLYEALTTYNAQAQATASTAESWTHSPDFKVWTFNIRHNAKWSNGDPVTAQDFVTSWRRLVDPKNGFAYAFFLRDLKLKNVDDIVLGKKPPEMLGVRAIDDHTFEVTLDAPVPWFFKATADASLAPVPTKLLQSGKWPDPNHLVGNGPYKLVQRIPNEKYVVVRNHNYWDDAHTIIEKATYHIVRSESSVYQRVLSGDLDAVALSSPSLIASTQKLSHSLLRIQNQPSDQMIWFGFNLTRPPFNDIRVRKAIQLALDTTELQDKVFKGTVVATSRFTSNNLAGATQIPQAPYFTMPAAQRLAQAQALLAQAGYSPEHPLKFDIAYTNTEQYKLTALAFQGMLKRAFGKAVTTSFVTSDWNIFLQNRRRGMYDFYQSGWFPDFFDLSNFFGIWQTGNNVNDGTAFSNATYDRLYQSLYTTPTEAGRLKVYKQLNQILTQEVPAVVAYQGSSTWLVNQQLQGFSNIIRRLKFMYRVAKPPVASTADVTTRVTANTTTTSTATTSTIPVTTTANGH